MMKPDAILYHGFATNIQTKPKMQVSKRIINKWASLKEHGDVDYLAGLTNKNSSTISRVLAGKQDTTPEVILIITEFYKKRKKLVAQIQDDNN